MGTPHASHVQLKVHQPRLDYLNVHVFQATIERLMKDLVWPALVSDLANSVAHSNMYLQCAVSIG